MDITDRLHHPLTQVRGSTVSVSVHGPGLTGPEQNRIFDRFYRATEARSLPGPGLGLSVV